jgi:multicomponent Na+:H+ antiporter subunit E
MNMVLVALILALIWAAVTGTFTLVNLLFGFAVGVLAMWLLRDQVARPRSLRKARKAIVLFVVFLRELLVSATKVALQVLDPNLKAKLKPAFVSVPLDLKTDGQITLLANMITLTPGTLSVDVSDDRKVLVVHALDVVDRESLVREIKTGFEARVREAFADERH